MKLGFLTFVLFLCCQLVAGLSDNYKELLQILETKSENITSIQKNHAHDLIKKMPVSELNEWGRIL